jgi:hypothetical protein
MTDTFPHLDTHVYTLPMTASGVTPWFVLPEWAEGFDFAWPAGPVGTISVELTSDKSDLTRVVVVNGANGNPAPTQPTGAADRTYWGLATGEPFARVRLVLSSAGAGVLVITVNGKKGQ